MSKHITGFLINELIFSKIYIYNVNKATAHPDKATAHLI